MYPRGSCFSFQPGFHAMLNRRFCQMKRPVSDSPVNTFIHSAFPSVNAPERSGVERQTYLYIQLNLAIPDPRVTEIRQ